MAKYSVHYNFLEYHRVKQCVNNFLGKSDTSINERPIYPITLYLLSKGIKGSYEFHKILLSQKCFNDDKLRHKWERSLNIEITKPMWEKSFLVCFKTMQDNYLIWFQYKILNRIFRIESLKFKMGISQNNVCRLCDENEETLVHLFTLCNPVKKIWEDLTRRIKTNINRDLIFSSKDIILGYQEKQMWPVNILLVIMKKYIFVASGKKKTPQLVEALEMLKNIYFEQEYVSRIQNHESEFKKKWDFIPRLLQ